MRPPTSRYTNRVAAFTLHTTRTLGVRRWLPPPAAFPSSASPPTPARTTHPPAPQHLQLSETDSTGKLLQTWFFEGTAQQFGSIAHGEQTNEVDSYDGIKAMLDDNHLLRRHDRRWQVGDGRR